MSNAMKVEILELMEDAMELVENVNTTSEQKNQLVKDIKELQEALVTVEMGIMCNLLEMACSFPENAEILKIKQ